MPILAVALLAIALTNGVKARAPAVPESHILLLDRSALKADDPALDNSFDIAVRDVESRIMTQHQANLILDKSAAAEVPGGVDVTAEAVAALARAEPGWTPPQAVAPAQNVPSPIPPAHILVVDTSWLRSSGKSDTGLSDVLDKIAASRHATVVLRRDIVVIGAPGLDTTALTASSLYTFQSTGRLSLDSASDAPVARVAIIDRQALLRKSAVGENIAARVHELVKSTEDELRPESLSLKKEGELLQAEAANLAPDEKDRQMADFKQRRDAFAQKVRQRQDQLRMAVAVAQKHVEGVAGPIVQQIVKDSGANMLIDRTVVVFGDNTLDMTPLALNKLNAVLQSVELSLPPPGAK